MIYNVDPLESGSTLAAAHAAMYRRLEERESRQGEQRELLPDGLNSAVSLVDTTLSARDRASGREH